MKQSIIYTDPSGFKWRILSKSDAEFKHRRGEVVYKIITPSEIVPCCDDDFDDDDNVFATDRYDLSQEFRKQLYMYQDVKNDLFTYTDDLYDQMRSDIEGWEELLDSGEYTTDDIATLTEQVLASQKILSGYYKLNFRYV